VLVKFLRFITGSKSKENTGTSKHPNTEWVYYPSSVTETMAFSTKALADLPADGLMTIFIQSVTDDFIVDKAVLTAIVIRGEAPPYRCAKTDYCCPARAGLVSRCSIPP
jgi:hypothetical protein